MKRPAEQLVEELTVYANGRDKFLGPNVEVSVIPLDTVKRWLGLAKKIDARMRLDGSKLNKRKKAK